jgi:mono/diheme cytochrome c family protein
MTSRRLSFFGALLASIAWFSCSNQGNNSSTNDQAEDSGPVNGQQLFVENCASCHQRDRDAIGPALAGVVARWENDTAAVRDFIRSSAEAASNGSKRAIALRQKWNINMPPYAGFSDRQIDAILGYIESK